MAKVFEYNSDIAPGTPLNVGVGGIDATGGAQFASLNLRATDEDPTFGNCLTFTPTAAGQLGYVDWNLPSAPITEYGVRAYVKKVTGTAGNAEQFCGFRSSVGGYSTRFAISGSAAPNQARLYRLDSTLNYATPNNTMMPGDWYRYEAYVKTDTDDWRFLLYLGDSLTPINDSGWQNSDVAGQIGIFRFGPVNNTPATPDVIRMAHILITDDADVMIGPYEAPSGGMFVKTAGGLVDAGTMFVKTGATVVPVTGVTTK